MSESWNPGQKVAANTVLAGPTTGGSGAVVPRALVTADVPTLNQNTTGNAATAWCAPVTLAFNASLTPDTATGLFRYVALTGDATLHPPTNPSNGMRWEICIFGNPAGAQNFTFDAAIKIPDMSAFSGVQVINATKFYTVLLKYYPSGFWGLVSIVGGY